MTGTRREIPIVAWLDRTSASAWKVPVLTGLLLASAYYSPLPLMQFLFLLPMLRRLDLRPAAGHDFRDGWLMGVVATFVGMHFWAVPAIEITWLAALLWALLAAALALRFGLTWLLLAWLRRRTGWSYALLLPLV